MMWLGRLHTLAMWAYLTNSVFDHHELFVRQIDTVLEHDWSRSYHRSFTLTRTLPAWTFINAWIDRAWGLPFRLSLLRQVYFTLWCVLRLKIFESTLKVFTSDNSMRRCHNFQRHAFIPQLGYGGSARLKTHFERFIIFIALNLLVEFFFRHERKSDSLLWSLWGSITLPALALFILLIRADNWLFGTAARGFLAWLFIKSELFLILIICVIVVQVVFILFIVVLFINVGRTFSLSNCPRTRRHCLLLSWL